MKKILALAFIAFALSSSAQNIYNANEISVTITGATTRADLKTISTSMRELGLAFKCTPKFDGQTHLIGVTYIIADAAGNELGRAENNHLATEGAQSKFRMRKQNDRFELICAGTCD